MNVQQILDEIAASTDERQKVLLDEILDKIGHRSFGTILLFTGLITLAPIIGDIPGVPTTMGTLVFLTAIQLFFQRRKYFWLPQWLLKRSIDQNKLCKGVKLMRPVARGLDAVSHPRLDALTERHGRFIIAVICLIIAISMPPMEFIPFSANFAGAALTLFGVALITRDGLFAVFGYFFMLLVIAAIFFGL